MDSARPRKMPRSMVPIRETFSVNKRVCRKQTIEIVLKNFVCFSFSKFTFSFHGFHLKKLKLIQLIFELAPEENLVVNNKDNRVFMSRNYRLIVDPWKFDVLKTSIFAPASLLEQIFVLRTSNFRGETISRLFARQQHSIV